jgi:hypothetical protein
MDQEDLNNNAVESETKPPPSSSVFKFNKNELGNKLWKINLDLSNVFLGVVFFLVPWTYPSSLWIWI